MLKLILVFSKGISIQDTHTLLLNKDTKDSVYADEEFAKLKLNVKIYAYNAVEKSSKNEKRFMYLKKRLNHKHVYIRSVISTSDPRKTPQQFIGRKTVNYLFIYVIFSFIYFFFMLLFVCLLNIYVFNPSIVQSFYHLSIFCALTKIDTIRIQTRIWNILGLFCALHILILLIPLIIMLAFERAFVQKIAKVKNKPVQTFLYLSGYIRT